MNYLYDGRLVSDNNLMENAIRPIAFGRKNYLFAESQSAAQNIAVYPLFLTIRHQLANVEVCIDANEGAV